MIRRIFLWLLLAAVALAQAPAQAPPPPDKDRWNKVFTGTNPVSNNKPNAFLVEAVTGRKPGKALDIGLGQGRNSVFLAQQGWDVTGLDISDEGARIARENAAKLGLKINVVLQSVDDFDFGQGRWDLIAGIFMQGVIPRIAARLPQALKPGGILVIEGYHEDRAKVADSARSGYKNNQLLRLFDGLRIVHYQDHVAPADWDAGKDMPIVSFIARKE